MTDVIGFMTVEAFLADRILSPPGLAMDVGLILPATQAFSYQVGAQTSSYNTLRVSPANQTWGFGDGVVPLRPGIWGIWLFCLDRLGGQVTVPGGATYLAGYNFEADAIAALPSAPDGLIPVAYFTIASQGGYVPGVDSLLGRIAHYYDAPFSPIAEPVS